MKVLAWVACLSVGAVAGLGLYRAGYLEGRESLHVDAVVVEHNKVELRVSDDGWPP